MKEFYKESNKDMAMIAITKPLPQLRGEQTSEKNGHRNNRNERYETIRSKGNGKGSMSVSAQTTSTLMTKFGVLNNVNINNGNNVDQQISADYRGSFQEITPQFVKQLIQPKFNQNQKGDDIQKILSQTSYQNYYRFSNNPGGGGGFGQEYGNEQNSRPGISSAYNSKPPTRGFRFAPSPATTTVSNSFSFTPTNLQESRYGQNRVIQMSSLQENEMIPNHYPQASIESTKSEKNDKKGFTSYKHKKNHNFLHNLSFDDSNLISVNQTPNTNQGEGVQFDDTFLKNTFEIVGGGGDNRDKSLSQLNTSSLEFGESKHQNCRPWVQSPVGNQKSAQFPNPNNNQYTININNINSDQGSNQQESGMPPYQ